MKSNAKLSILKSTNMPPSSSLKIKVMSNRQQPVAITGSTDPPGEGRPKFESNEEFVE
jgi:hypothetical protein